MFSGKATLPVSMKKVNITSKVLSFLNWAPHWSFCQKINLTLYIFDIRFNYGLHALRLKQSWWTWISMQASRLLQKYSSTWCRCVVFWFWFFKFCVVLSYVLKVRNLQDVIFQPGQLHPGCARLSVCVGVLCWSWGTSLWGKDWAFRWRCAIFLENHWNLLKVVSKFRT